MDAAMIFIASGWFWLIGGDTARAWSSAAAAYVPTSGAAYQAFLAAGNVPARIGSEAVLADVLRVIYPPGLGTLGPRFVPLSVIRERVTAAGKWPAFCAALDILPSDKRWHLLTLAEGVASDDADAHALLESIGCDPDPILAP